MRRLAVLLPALAALALSGCGDEERSEASVPAGFFGVAPQEAPTEPDLARMAAGGIESYHLLLSWARVEVAEGRYDWSRYDDLIGRLVEHGIQPMPYVFGTPELYADSPTDPPTESEAALAAFERFLDAAADRYGPGGVFWTLLAATNPEVEPRPLRVWEIWNEVNAPAFWTEPSPEAYAELLRRSEAALTGSDPGAQIMTAGMFATPADEAAIESFEFLRRLYEQDGIAELVDLVGIHPYGPRIEDVRGQIERTRKVVDAEDPGTPLWVTEIGWGSDPQQPSQLAKSPDRQAALLGRAYEMFLDNRDEWMLEGAHWYTWRDPANQRAPGLCGWCRSAGLVDDDLDSKPAWVTYAALAGGRP